MLISFSVVFWDIGLTLIDLIIFTVSLGLQDISLNEALHDLLWIP